MSHASNQTKLITYTYREDREFLIGILKLLESRGEDIIFGIRSMETNKAIPLPAIA